MPRSSYLMFIGGVLLAIAAPVLGQVVSQQFRDVAGNEYYADSVENLSRVGIIQGYDSGRFGPDDTVTRGQVAVMINRYDTTVVAPMRRQIDILREQLGLGRCGDGVKQDGEVCDDGNTQSGDGCSSSCVTEVRVPVSHQSSSREQGYPQCNPLVCPDGTEIPTCTDDGYIINYFANPCLTHQLSSSSVSSVDQTSCASDRTTFNQIVQQNRGCRTDADCTLLEMSCPYLTCGTAINVDALDSARRAGNAYLNCRANLGEPNSCANCLRTIAVCRSGLCVEQEL